MGKRLVARESTTYDQMLDGVAQNIDVTIEVFQHPNETGPWSYELRLETYANVSHRRWRIDSGSDDTCLDGIRPDIERYLRVCGDGFSDPLKKLLTAIFREADGYAHVRFVTSRSKLSAALKDLGLPNMSWPEMREWLRLQAPAGPCSVILEMKEAVLIDGWPVEDTAVPAYR